MRLGISPVGGKVGGDAVNLGLKAVDLGLKAVDFGLDARQPHFNPRQALIQLLYAEIHPVHALGQSLLPFDQQIELVQNALFYYSNLPGNQRALAAVALGDFSGTALAEAAQSLTELGFSREAEREADREGLRRLAAAQVDPGGMVRFFEKLAKESTMAPPALLSTHPATEERLSELRREVAALSGDWLPLAIDLTAVRAALPAP